MISIKSFLTGVLYDRIMLSQPAIKAQLRLRQKNSFLITKKRLRENYLNVLLNLIHNYDRGMIRSGKCPLKEMFIAEKSGPESY